MNTFIKLLLGAILITSIGMNPLSAQSWEERDEQREEQRHWFWDWLFDTDNDDEYWDEPYVEADDYQDIVMRINFSRRWRFSIGDNKNWASSSYNDSYWETIKVPAYWEEDGFHGYDGYAWYRIHFDGRELDQQESHFLVLGTIDDVDETFLNGEMIGKSGRFPPPYRTAYNHERKYFIPTESINFEGDNVIAIRVFDEHQGGGIVGGRRPGIYAAQGSEKLLQDLYGQWKFINNNNNAYSRPNFDDSQWENLLVPEYWDNQGYRSFDGIAWYRKRFSICFQQEEGKTYYLTLGKIDDFDITYLNGQQIGQTDDGEKYGRSQSYNQIRMYKIPPGLLSERNENVIAVKVYDIGNHGGIYKGQIGIVEEADLTKFIRQRQR